MMTDVLTREQRTHNMKSIRARDTGPEMALRKALHRLGLRYRIHRRDIPGVPDIVFPSKRITVFVDGCFWHGCPIHGKPPASNRDFWINKIMRNQKRDKQVNRLLKDQGWRVLRFWEHEVKDSLPLVTSELLSIVRPKS